MACLVGILQPVCAYDSIEQITPTHTYLPPQTHPHPHISTPPQTHPHISTPSNTPTPTHIYPPSSPPNTPTPGPIPLALSIEAVPALARGVLTHTGKDAPGPPYKWGTSSLEDTNHVSQPIYLTSIWAHSLALAMTAFKDVGFCSRRKTGAYKTKGVTQSEQRALH